MSDKLERQKEKPIHPLQTIRSRLIYAGVLFRFKLEAAMKKVHVFLSLTILLISCITLAPTPAPQPTYEPIPRIPTTDPSQPIEVQAGEDFQIVIDANPTTGYHWEILGELDAGIVEFVSREYNNDEPVTVGSGGVDIWTFKALFAGTAQITLGSYPPSLDPTGPEGTVTFTVSIH